MAPIPATGSAADDSEDLLPRWMKSVIAHKTDGLPALPFQRAAKQHPGSLPAPAHRAVAIAAR